MVVLQLILRCNDFGGFPHRGVPPFSYRPLGKIRGLVRRSQPPVG
jgi:hypothetical protein